LYRRKNFWAFICVILLYKLGDACAASLSTTFLIRALQLPLGQVGLSTKIMGLSGTLLGAFYAGMLLKKLPLLNALWIFGILQTLTNIGYVALTMLPPSIYTTSVVLFIENLTGGMGTAAFLAFLMSLCTQPAFTAAQYALLSAASAVGRVVVSPLSAYFVQHWGWGPFFWSTVLIGFLGLLPLWGMRTKKGKG
jgi:MFS transporter, PAT family, beta-lactamase induction signal transducer AmpG